MVVALALRLRAGRRTNLALLLLLAVAVVTGALAFAIGGSWVPWAVITHGVAGLGFRGTGAVEVGDLRTWCSTAPSGDRLVVRACRLGRRHDRHRDRAFDRPAGLPRARDRDAASRRRRGGIDPPCRVACPYSEDRSASDRRFPAESPPRGSAGRGSGRWLRRDRRPVARGRVSGPRAPVHGLIRAWVVPARRDAGHAMAERRGPSGRSPNMGLAGH